MQILATFNASNDVSISNQTVDKYCQRMGLSRGPSVKKQLLQPRHRRIRLDWCKPRRFWTIDDHWSRVIFSDESMGDNYRIYVWKRKGEGYRPDLYSEKTIQSNHVSKLWYGVALPGTVSERFLLWMQRNTYIHSRRICGQLFSEIFLRVAKYFKMMGHWCIRLTSSRLGKERTELTPSRPPLLPPPTSPDLNPIENCWAVIKKKLQQQHDLEVESEIDLKTRICVLWQSLSISYIKQLCLSMPRRIRQVQVFKGHRAKY